MKPLLIATALTLGLSGAALAQMQPSNPAKTGLSRPVIQLTGFLAKNMDVLELNDEQRADVKNWVASMPANRKALETETIELRATLRQAIVDGKPTEERQAIADKIGANEVKLVMMRSNCTDHWREVLTEAQFAKLLEIAGVS
ncbi:Spy/CpxP family protein refolding chaperone [Aliiroseovarius sp. F20344]|uniref:Spy/CpxP family protein refolding chaperone n=1 Tax=Aliiroseovarius sp. F20344 TaxID=2926414 RepID=UPI001FF2A17F|nr:Spy/CpxP family protein refolding chaperone [Aliiroseovarius sp. F20344]MCK0144015.1 Spy/CpxP family protein refolding chaperone [Aliiroseovarius sp. F20344]